MSCDPWDEVDDVALIADIADAVVQLLNDATWSQSFTAVRRYVPLIELKDLAELKVTVIVVGEEVETASREADQHEYEIHVGVQKRVINAENANVDPLIALCEEISEAFANKELGTSPAAWCISRSPKYYDGAWLREERRFTGVIELKFRVLK